MRAMAFVAVFGPIYERYQESLAGSEEIDFHDMINRATELVESGRFRSPFKYILVDEFQDISPSRAALLDNSPGAQLFAVGDDWQAIYRFAGSDSGLFVRGEKIGSRHTRLVADCAQGRRLHAGMIGNRQRGNTPVMVPPLHRNMIAFANDLETKLP